MVTYVARTLLSWRRVVSNTRVGHTCRVYFKEFVTYPHVVSILMLSCPCNIDGDQTRHHIHSQCGESVSINIEDYSLANRNKDFEISKESSGERSYLDHGHTRVPGFSDAEWVGCLFIGGQPQNIVSLLEEILCHRKAKKQSMISRSSTESEYRAMTNVTLELIWIKKKLVSPRMSCETIW